MAQAYLVGHGGALSPNTPGGNPVGNALGTASTIMGLRDQRDRTAIAQQEVERRTRALDIEQKENDLKNFMSEREVWGQGTPQRQEINNRLLGIMGITETSHVAPEAVDNMVTQTQKRLSNLQHKYTVGKLSEDAYYDGVGSALFAVHDAINKGNGTLKEKEAMRGATDMVGASALRGSEDIGQTTQHGIRAGQDAAATIRTQDNAHDNSIALEDARQINRMALEGARAKRPVGTKAGTNPAQGAAKEIVLELLRGARDVNKKGGTRTTTTKIGETEISKTETVPTAITAEQILAATEQASQIVESIFPPSVTPTDAESAARVDLTNKVNERVQAGQDPKVAALGAVSDVAGPTLAYGLPDATETTPDFVGDAIEVRLDMWDAAHPAATPEERAQFVELLLGDAGYLIDGVVAPKFEDTLKKILTKRGLVE